MRKKPKYKQGFFKPVHPEKYKGNIDQIIFRSGLELKFFNYMDLNPNILQWSSEEIFVVYCNPYDNKLHRYFIDLWIKTKDHEVLVEIKPYSLTIEPKKPKKITKSFLQRVYNYNLYHTKKKYAEIYAKKHNMIFKVFTEKDL